jgi:hypothetical protein
VGKVDNTDHFAHLKTLTCRQRRYYSAATLGSKDM